MFFYVALLEQFVLHLKCILNVISNVFQMNHANQENIKNVKSSVAVPGKRAALGEISNRVNTLRGTEPIDRTSLLQKDKKKVIVQKRPVVKGNVSKKPLDEKAVEIAKPVKHVETIMPIVDGVSASDVALISVSKKKERKKSFSRDLLKFEDIDEQDNKNPILVSLYTIDIYEYLKSLEDKFPIKKEYLADQEITPKMRSVLIDWLIEVHQQFRLLQETLYLTVAIIDRFLQVKCKQHNKFIEMIIVHSVFFLFFFALKVYYIHIFCSLIGL